MSEKDKTYQYVPHHQKEDWEALGWDYDSELQPPYAAYGSMYVWALDGDPVFPATARAVAVKSN